MLSKTLFYSTQISKPLSDIIKLMLMSTCRVSFAKQVLKHGGCDLLAR